MADQEQLARLKKGVLSWNRWRKEYPEIKIDLRDAYLGSIEFSGPDLQRADLSNADLSGACLWGKNLNNVNLFHANLSCANLRETTLKNANLCLATLKQAILSFADLSQSDLSRADLSNADLHESNLSWANLIGANLINTNLSGAIFEWTVVAHVDLRKVIGLATINHEGPSMIEFNSVYLPFDRSAEVFLRGAGISDHWIDIYRTKQFSAIDYHSLFISYASQDDLLARRLHADLQAKGVRCWFAPHSLEPGDFFRDKIDQAIHMHDRMVLILSEHSVKSKWVAYEVNQAIDREIDQQRVILYPIRIDDSVLESQQGWAAALKKRRHIGDFTRWNDAREYQEVFDQLLKHLQPKT